ncbi:MAG: hypothetical protein ABI643_00935 [Candidatus Doudnabacteria bacterium]
MPRHLEIKEQSKLKLAEAVISTLAFFSLYNLPLSAKRVYELLLGMRSTQDEVDRMLANLVLDSRIIREGNLFGLKIWDAAVYNANQLELTKKWQKIDRYFNWLAILPFVRNISVINSLALGTADSDSDIDFFVVTKPNRLYFVRSMIIVLFRLLGVYKTRQRIKDRFCFGFFVSQKNRDLYHLLIKPSDPYLVFWLAGMRPLLGAGEYQEFMAQNSWIKTYFPNFDPTARQNTIRRPGILIQVIKIALEICLWAPSLIAEPILRRVHIRHTFRLAENKSVTSTTIAHADMLKLHGYDVRAEIAYRYEEAVNQFRNE